jgi:hypothetical protein
LIAELLSALRQEYWRLSVKRFPSVEMLLIQSKVLTDNLIAVVRTPSPGPHSIVSSRGAEIEIVDWGFIIGKLRCRPESIHLGDDHIPAGYGALMHVRAA